MIESILGYFILMSVVGLIISVVTYAGIGFLHFEEGRKIEHKIQRKFK